MSNQTSDNNKRIAKNTLLLYVRMILIMIISLFTSRVNLQSLGVEDFGIYNVVGGVVAMFSVISGTLATAISRFITFELGRNNGKKINIVFSTSVTIQLFLAVFIVIIAEIVGIWFLHNKMSIPDERLGAATWVMHLSILTFAINLISVPYNAAIIAHEKMKAFAYVSLFEVTIKLLICYALFISPCDRLITYGVLLFLLSCSIRIIYGVYCKRNFSECSYKFTFDKSLIKEIFSYCGWNFIGSSAAILRDQGVNIVLNIFCGPVVNAARGIAFQVNTAVNSFVVNFMTALNPQITKSYATGDISYMTSLVFKGSRIAFYLLLLLTLPIFFETDIILHLWLKNYPDHTSNFIRLILLLAISESLSHTIITSVCATGKIKLLQISSGIIQLLNFPISYCLLYWGFVPESTIVASIILSQCCFVARLYVAHKEIGLSMYDYFKQVYGKVLLVGCIAIILPLFVCFIMDDSLLRFISVFFISIFSAGISIFFLGCTNQERLFLKKKILKIK